MTKSSLIIIALLSLFVWACDDMHDNYKDYVKERIYPGKVDSIRVYVGYQKAYFGWETPTDAKSKKIVVKYGKDSIVTASNIDTLIIPNLTSGSGYEFEIFSVDEFWNSSVKSYKTMLPVSDIWVQNNMLVPNPKFKPADGVHTDSLLVKWSALSNDFMYYVGDLSYTLKKGEATISEGKGMANDWKNGNESLKIKNLDITAQYSIDYKMKMIPRVSGKNIVDTVTISKSIQFVPKDYQLPPMYLLIQSKGWDANSFIAVNAVSEGVYRGTFELKYGDNMRLFKTAAMDAEDQYAYAHFSKGQLAPQVGEATDGSGNLRFQHADGTYIIDFDIIGKKVLVKGTVTEAFQGLTALIPGRIEAENFNNGGEGVGYHDNDANNAGGAYRDTGVDISSGPTGNYNVGWTGTGEWLMYTVDIVEAGTYQVDFSIGSPNNPGNLILELDGEDILTFKGTNTGGWGNFQVQSGEAIELPKGRHKLKLKMDNPGMNIDAMIFTKK
ncbi:carbohydrate-binding protein [Prolixibacteraceae bacterium JC049]|nr:carbohydrate-binding protein [Prolixibacteraceae bacterium JC049]